MLFYNAINSVVWKNQNQEQKGIIGIYFNTDIRMGPSTNFQDYTTMEQAKYSRFYYVTKEMLELHAWQQNYPNPNYVPPHGILHWPAHGDPAKGQSANLAPFYDLNSNGIYEPLLGEYPKIVGDECILKLMHRPDYLNSQNNLDIFMYCYKMQCDTNKIINDVLFSQTEIISRGQLMDSVMMFSDVDPHIGTFEDDFVGSHIGLNLIYGYNGDDFDESNADHVGFGSVIPAAGIQILRGIKKKSNQADDPIGVNQDQSINGNGFGDGIIDNEFWGMTSNLCSPYQFNLVSYMPSTVAQYYNVANGKTKLGDTRLVNGIPVKHNFFGNSDPLFYASGGVNHGNNSFDAAISGNTLDRFAIMSSGPGTFTPNDTIRFLQAALVAVDNLTVSSLNSVQKLIDKAALLKFYFETNDIGCGKSFDPIPGDLGMDEQYNSKLDIALFPNPNTGSFILTGSFANANIQVFDLMGKEVAFVADSNQFMLVNHTQGLYLVHVHTDMGSAVLKMIVK